MMQSIEAKFYYALSFLVGVPMLAGLAGTVVSLGCECLYWLRFGAWPKWSILNATGPIPPTGFIGLDRIISRVSDGPLYLQFLAIFLISLAVLALVETLRENAERKKP